jgi:hypothetical protein
MKIYSDNRPTMVVQKNGREYVLVEIEDRELSGLPRPNFMGFSNYALKSVKKLTGETDKKQKIKR